MGGGGLRRRATGSQCRIGPLASPGSAKLGWESVRPGSGTSAVGCREAAAQVQSWLVGGVNQYASEVGQLSQVIELTDLVDDWLGIRRGCHQQDGPGHKRRHSLPPKLCAGSYRPAAKRTIINDPAQLMTDSLQSNVQAEASGPAVAPKAQWGGPALAAYHPRLYPLTSKVLPHGTTPPDDPWTSLGGSFTEKALSASKH